MLGFITPEQAGISEQAIKGFMREIKRRGINMHSVLMMKGNDIFFERYWQPYTADTIHRMYSVTKTFVSIAVGLLLDEGKIALDDRIIDYFPDKQPENIHRWMKEQTIRHMLTMNTCYNGVDWFKPDEMDRTKLYFDYQVTKPAGTVFSYDSTGSYVLGILVERVTGMSLIDYLRKKVLDKLGGFESAHILHVPDGGAWGDSGLLCTPRALATFARFVMNMGKWNGEQLLSEQYLREATSLQVTTDLECKRLYNTYGYGYQIWMNERGYSFQGMGGQLALCVPEEDFVFVCTGDNQYNDGIAEETIFRAVFDHIIPEETVEEEEEPLQLPVAHGKTTSAFADVINGKTFKFSNNHLKLKWFRLEFEGDEGRFVYENAQGEKVLPFGMRKNLFCKFPQLGYSDEYGNIHEITDFMYDCASSAAWVEEQKLQLRVQIIDRYFGTMVATFGFRDENTVGVMFLKRGEDFLKEYWGMVFAEAEQ